MTFEKSYPCARINAPELCEDAGFNQWLHLRTTSQPRLASWHHAELTNPIPAGEYSDIFLWVEHGEGSDNDMPSRIWEKILETLGPKYCGLVWISFLK